LKRRVGEFSAIFAFITACASAPPTPPPPVIPLPSWATNITNDGSWLYLGKFSGNVLLFYSPSSVKKYRGLGIDYKDAYHHRVAVWGRLETESKKPTEAGGKSDLMHYDIDCDKSAFNVDEVVSYGQHNMIGSPNMWRHEVSELDSWVEVPPGTLVATLVRRVCG
jgi:Surface-adhesin protein E